jgi:hypothetical protein
MAFNSDAGLAAALPDIDRILSIVDPAFVRDTLPAEDVRVGFLPPTLIGDDGDPIIDSLVNGMQDSSVQDRRVLDTAEATTAAEAILKQELAAVELALEAAQALVVLETGPPQLKRTDDQ